MQNYKQCLLTNNGYQDISWIPSQFAREGKILSIKIDNEWVNGWLVEEVYPSICTREDIDNIRSQNKRFKFVLGE